MLNYLRDREHFHLPDGFTEFPLLTAEAQYYALPGLTARLTGEQAQLNYIELIETCHPEKIGVCSARVVLSEALKVRVNTLVHEAVPIFGWNFRLPSGQINLQRRVFSQFEFC